MIITDLIDFSGRVAVVTGGATGIGYATALQLAKLGASVVIASRTRDELEAAAARISEESGQRCVAVVTDVKDEAACIRLIQNTIDVFGRIDVLVNNAGGTRLGPLKDLPTKAWDSIVDLNLKSAYILTREAGQHMIARNSGAIINVSSSAGSHGVKGGAHYSAAKAGLEMFTQVAAAEWGQYGIRVNCVAAGMIASPRAVEGWKRSNVAGEHATGAIPMRRTGTPEEMAHTIVFLASDAASYITAQVIGVNGGPPMSGN